ncbi:HtrA protease/chaperone protein, partial [Chlamydia pneumoniae B21]
MITKQLRSWLAVLVGSSLLALPLSGQAVGKKESRVSELPQDVLLKEISGGFSKV